MTAISFSISLKVIIVILLNQFALNVVNPVQYIFHLNCRIMPKFIGSQIDSHMHDFIQCILTLQFIFFIFILQSLNEIVSWHFILPISFRTCRIYISYYNCKSHQYIHISSIHMTKVFYGFHNYA